MADCNTDCMDNKVDATQGGFGDISLKDLKLVSTLGRGNFATVTLVRLAKDPSVTFAMKTMIHQKLNSKAKENLINEAAIMKSCNSLFICRMFKCIQDEDCTYLIQEACVGNMLSIFENCTDEYDAKFIGACVVKALEYLHDRSIVHRDLKLENLLVDYRGYVKITDLGFAKLVENKEKTRSFCGTYDYMAPEMIRKQAHDRAVDYWGLGILIYVLLTGRLPFMDNNLRKLFFKILKGFNENHFKDIGKSATDLIRNLCRLEANERIGYANNGVADIMNHEWFEGFDWKSLTDGTLSSPVEKYVKQAKEKTNNLSQF